MSCLRFYFGKLCRAVDNFFCEKIWWSEKKAVPLFANGQLSAWREKCLIRKFIVL